MTNLFSRFSKIANLILLQTTIVVAIGFNNQAHAQLQLTSESGNLIVERLRSDEESCATGQPAASYFVRGGVNGLLYPYDCSYLELRGEGISYTFADTSGVEKCKGKATVVLHGSVGQRGEATMIWEVRGAVSGYSCSTIGQSYEYIMY